MSAAFILIGSKVGDLIGRKRAFVLGLLGYALGALAMAFAQGLTAIIVFWAIVGGLGASLLLPAMQSLIHGNFQGAAQKKAYALVGAAAAIAAAVGPLLGGFLTTFLSWRVGFLLEVVVIAVVLSGLKLIHDVPYTGPRAVDVVGAVLSAVGMGGVVIGILVWQEGGEFVGVLIAVGLVALGSLARWLVRRKRDGKPTLLDPDLFKLDLFRLGHLVADAAEHRARRGDDRPADLPADGPGVQRPADRPDARAAVADDVRDGARRRQAGGQATAREHHPPRIGTADRRHAAADPDRPACGLRLGARHPADDRRGRTGPAGVPAQQLHPLADLRRARQRGRRRQLRRRVVRAVVRARVRRSHHARDALDRVHPDGSGQHGAAGRRPGAGRAGARGRRGGDEQHPARGAARRSAGRRSRTRSSASTPTHDRSPCRSRCSSRSSPACSGCSTGSA